MTKIEAWYELEGRSEPEDEDEVIKDGIVYHVSVLEFEEEMSDLIVYFVGLGMLFNSDWCPGNEDVRIYKNGVWLEHV